MSITLTEKAAGEVKRIIAEQQQSGTGPEKIYLRMRVVGGGCSGFQHKLDLDPQINEKLDEVSEIHGVPVAIDKRSLMYLDNVTVDFHDDLNRRGFSISNPGAKSTCGCGSSFSM
jgi:iron-sulfur cluster assembly accessory protein